MPLCFYYLLCTTWQTGIRLVEFVVCFLLTLLGYLLGIVYAMHKLFLNGASIPTYAQMSETIAKLA